MIHFIPRNIFNKYHIPRGREGEGRETEVEKEEGQRERDRWKIRDNDRDIETKELRLRWRETRIRRQVDNCELSAFLPPGHPIEHLRSEV